MTLIILCHNIIVSVMNTSSDLVMIIVLMMQEPVGLCIINVNLCVTILTKKKENSML